MVLNAMLHATPQEPAEGSSALSFALDGALPPTIWVAALMMNSDDDDGRRGNAAEDGVREAVQYALPEFSIDLREGLRALSDGGDRSI